MPPSITISAPVINRDSSEAKNKTPYAISTGSAMNPNGIVDEDRLGFIDEARVYSALKKWLFYT